METITLTDAVISFIIIVTLLISFHLIRSNFKKIPAGIDTCSGIRYFNNQRQIQSCTYQLIYPDFKRFVVLSDNLHDLYHEFILKRWGKTATFPTEIELPDGRIVIFNNSIFNGYLITKQFGSTEEELIQTLLDITPSILVTTV